MMPNLGTTLFGDLVVAWKGVLGDDRLFYSSFDGSNWAPQAEIPGVGSSVGPSLAVFNGQLYAAWKDAGFQQQLFYSSFDGSNWTPPPLPIIPGASSQGASLTWFDVDGQLYTAWKGPYSGPDSNNQQLFYSSFDGSNWAPPGEIPGWSYMGASLTAFNGQLYAVWVGAYPDSRLWYSSFDGSSWAPQTQIPGAGSGIDFPG